VEPTTETPLPHRSVARRSVLAGGAALVCTAVGCGSTGPTSSPSTAAGRSSSTRANRSTTTVGAAAGTTPDWKALAQSLDGTLLRAGAHYPAVARLYNPRFDHLRPLAVVQAASTDDVVTTIQFATRYGLGLRPRSGGHSYVGASGADRGIQLDVRRLNRVGYNSSSRDVTVGAGANLLSVHLVLDKHARTVPTGTCATVGAGGFTLGGGLGVEDRAYGLTCDALESVTLVTAAGHLITASAHRNPDLLWACRGGGGGNFGVVTSFRYRTFPAHPMTTYYLRWADANTEDVIEGWQRRIPRQPGKAWANLHLDTSAGRVIPAVFGVTLDGSANAEANALIAAVGHAPSAGSVVSHSHREGVLDLAGCADATAAQCQLAPRGTLRREISVAGSDVLGRPLNRGERHALAQFLRTRARSGTATSVIVDPLGAAVARVDPAATAFPWRRALGTVQWYVGFNRVPSHSTVVATYDWIDQAHHVVRPASVGGYINYLEPGRSLSSYYGPNYARLRQLRRKYDPDRLLRGPYVIPL
jgi:FAD/FMN-containing dehydrogenase